MRSGASRGPFAPPLMVAVLSMWCLFTVISASVWLFNEQAQFVTLGSLASLIVTLPTVKTWYRLTSPWTLIIFTTYTGLGARGLFITLGVQGSGRTLDDLFLLGEEPSYFLGPSLLHVLGLFLVTVFFIGGRRRSATRAGVGAEQTQETSGADKVFTFSQYTPILLTAFAVFGAVAFYIYAQRTGGFSLDVISAKRTTIEGADLANYESHGVVRALNGFSAASFWVAIAYYTSKGKRFSPLSGPTILLTLMGINAIALPLFASSRSDAAFTLLVAWVVYAGVNGRRNRRRATRLLVLMLAALLALLALMTGLRAAGGASSGQEEVSWGDALGDALVFNRNFGDATITSHIVHHVPEILPYQSGATIAGYLIAPVPRAIWPDKPLISVGPQIGSAIYGNERSGVPPGMFGDMYLNFGVAGILLGSVALGLILAAVDRWRQRVEGRSLFWTVIYAGALFRVGMYAMNQGIGFMAFNALVALVPLVIVLGAVGSTKRDPAEHA